ncbi:MAG TPA: hypothetical protein VF813_02275, partial [Anaerolineaceae bacterium]
AIPPLTILDDAKREVYTTQMVIQFLHADPLGSAAKIVQRAAYFFAVEDRELMYFYSNNFFGAIPQPWLGLGYAAIILPWILVALLTPLGMLVAPGRRAAWLVAALLVGYTLPHLLVIAEPRFHLALVPVMIPAAAVAWSRRRELAQRWLSSPSAWAWAARLSPVLLTLLWIWGMGANWPRIIEILGPGGNHARWSY